MFDRWFLPVVLPFCTLAKLGLRNSLLFTFRVVVNRFRSRVAALLNSVLTEVSRLRGLPSGVLEFPQQLIASQIHLVRNAPTGRKEHLFDGLLSQVIHPRVRSPRIQVIARLKTIIAEH